MIRAMTDRGSKIQIRGRDLEPGETAQLHVQGRRRLGRKMKRSALRVVQLVSPVRILDVDHSSLPVVPARENGVDDIVVLVVVDGPLVTVEVQRPATFAHESSPVRSGPEAGTSDDPAGIVQESADTAPGVGAAGPADRSRPAVFPRRIDADRIVGARMRELRMQKELPPRELAAIMQVRGVAWTEGVVLSIETGITPLRLTDAVVLSDVLELASLSDLVAPLLVGGPPGSRRT